MLPVPFSFAGRIGRWSYFKACVLTVLSCIIPALLAMSFADGLRAGKTLALVGLIVFLGLCVIVIFWIGLTLQTRRCRDMGWNPLVAMLAWGAVQLLDPPLGYIVPSISTGGPGEGTVLGGVFNLVWFLALSFWPSSDDVGSPSEMRTPIISSGLPRSRVEALQMSVPRAVVPVPSNSTAAPGRVAFGRR